MPPPSFSRSTAPTAPAVGDHVVLVGMMGSGKTSVGRRVAEALDRPFIDTDGLVEADSGRPIAEIFAAEGEAGFRRHESAAVAKATSSTTPAVIATGGGAVLDPTNRERLARAGTVVWLSATVETLVGRVRTGDGRPLLADGAESVLLRLSAERTAFYGSMADAVVVVDDLTGEQVAECVLAACR